MHKTDDETTENIHDVKGRKGMEPSADVVTERNDQDHVEDLNSLKDSLSSSSTSTTTSSTTTTTSTTTKTNLFTTTKPTTEKITSYQNEI